MPCSFLCGSFDVEPMDMISKRQNCSALCEFFTRYQAAVREILFCFCSVMDSAPSPKWLLFLYLTSTNTMVLSSSMIRSISPSRLEKFLCSSLRPCPVKKDSAVFSQCAPALRVLARSPLLVVALLFGVLDTINRWPLKCYGSAGRKLCPCGLAVKAAICL